MRQLQMRLRDKLRAADYRPEIFKEAEMLYARCPSGDEHDPFYLKSRVLVSIVRDYRGQENACEAVASGERLLTRLEQHGFDPGDPPEVRREQVRFAAHFVRMYHYRRLKHYDEAVKGLQRCLALANKLAEPGVLPMFSTRAEISYFLGCALRQSGRLREANDDYHAAIDWARRRAEYRIARHAADLDELLAVPGRQASGDARRLEAAIHTERSFAQHRGAVASALGLGWVAYTRGRLDQALADYVNPAQLVFVGSHDPVHSAYASLIRGSIRRSLAGTGNLALLKEAVTDIETCWQVTTSRDYDHRAYATRAASELAQCYIRLFQAADSGKPDGAGSRAAYLTKAEEFIAEMEERADARWTSNAWILRSRIARSRGQHEKALKFSADAQAIVKDGHEPLARVDAAIAVAEAHLAMGDLEYARLFLNRALRESEQPATALGQEPEASNPKIKAIINLHLARTFLEDGRLNVARQHLNDAERLVPDVQHEFVKEQWRELAPRIQRAVDAAGSFVIRRDVAHLVYRRHLSDLQQWLLKQAEERIGGAHVQAAAIKGMLEVSRPTITAWRARRAATARTDRDRK